MASWLPFLPFLSPVPSLSSAPAPASAAMVPTPPGSTAPLMDAAAIGQLMQHVSHECSSLDKQLSRVLSEQAKGLVVEEQLEATTHTILQDIKPDLQDLIATYKADVREVLLEQRYVRDA